ncbi:hypothetical protein G7061_09235 [Erysipelothrix sp. HDW6B]|uniref:hypothetical protein n=1 Tax=Erysipelothrix sp. HDW6B TaxID=2714929 RepID=UPI0014080644|nr:hypothetical protein [Erysipelothrix sp. HDW6B]QIK86784.1 hypothetical protein G7061_09235 [Erysipelothrix sp. HDW6B]
MKKLVYKAIEMLLDGNNDVLDCLRKQWKQVEKLEYTDTGVGMFVSFSISTQVNILNNKHVKDTFPFGDVFGTVDGLFGAIGFIIFVEHGFLKTLEIYSIGQEFWEKVTDETELSYDSTPRDIKLLENSWKK